MIYSVKEMAEELDVSPFVINKYIKRFKLNGRFIQKEKNINILYFPQTAFEMIRDTLETNKVIAKNYYTTKQISELTGVTPSCVSNTAKRHKIDKIVRATVQSRVGYFAKEDAEKLIKLIQTNVDRRFKAAKKIEPCKVETLESAELHPLVKDKRCLRLSWWPDTIPVCLQEAEEND